MTNSNRIKLTWISFLSYALTGALVIVTGMVMGNIADYFNLPVSSMSNTFTFLNAGILISIFLNAWLMEIVPLKTQLRFGFLLMVLAVAGLMFSHSLALFSAAMFILGVVSGITMSIGTFLVTQMYEGRQRGSRLLFTDSFFSMAGMIFPMIAAFLLARSIEWYWVYACIGLVYVAIFILTFGCEFPALGKHAPKTDAPVEKEKWGIGVLFLSVAALCYIPGQLGFISWVPEYAKGLGMSLNDAGTLVSNFWMSYMVGMWAFSFILRTGFCSFGLRFRSIGCRFRRRSCIFGTGGFPSRLFLGFCHNILHRGTTKVRTFSNIYYSTIPLRFITYFK